MTDTSGAVRRGRDGAHARRRFWSRVWMLMLGSALAYIPVALAPHLLQLVARRADELAYDRYTPARSGVLTTLSFGEAAAVLGVLAALVIALNLIAWSLGPAISADSSPRQTEAIRLEHVELCGSVFGVGATMALVAALLDGLPESVDLAALLLFPAVFVIVVLSQDLYLATQRGVGARRMLRRESSLLRRRELLATAARFRPRGRPAAARPAVALGAELLALTIVTAVVGLSLLVVFDDPPPSAPVVAAVDAVFVVAASIATVLVAVVLVPWTVRCWLLRRYVGAVLAVAIGGTLYVVLCAGIVWAALDEDTIGEAFVTAVVLLGWTLLPPVALLVGTLGVRGRGYFPGVTATLHAALLRERYRLRCTDAGQAGEGPVPGWRPLVARARKLAHTTSR
ncbi:hypothetical protein [Rhodococcus sp. NPDC047139]|uniref:hypothetical protein n=1 Tax=Rhodococcus sp. NPDC047139 TaxID=3155141 RepID=UPI00340EC0B7